MGGIRSVGGKGLSSGWWEEVLGRSLKDTRLVEGGKLGGKLGTRYGGLAIVLGLGLGVVAVVCEVWVRAWERVIGRRDGGGEDWEECKPFRQASRWPKEVASARGGLCRTIVGVRRGIEESQPARIAWRKVDKAGEPKERWVYRTNSVSERLRILGTVGKREREYARGVPERAGAHTLPVTCVEKIGGDIGEEKKDAGRIGLSKLFFTKFACSCF
jgi:hypothetical protein